MKKVFKVLLIVLGSIVAIFVVIACLNIVSTITLRSYIKSFSKVQYDHQLVPVVEEEGYYTFRTDDDFRIMQISDIHLGGGHYSVKKDKKTIYEVMTMVSEEKPDLVILNGDNIFAVPGPMFNGGGTFNNKSASTTVIKMFEQLGVYYSVTFGNHDTEAFDYYDRAAIGKLYMNDKYKYCIFNSDFSDYGVTNQCILVKNNNGDIRKAIMLIDSNDYIDTSLSSSINWLYDHINDKQVDWAESVIKKLSGNGDPVKSLFFFHIPVGEFEVAYRDLKNNNFQDTNDTKLLSGVWDELVDEKMGGRIWYGGCHLTDTDPATIDKLFEVMGPSGLNSMQAIFVGHDHVNNATLEYKGVVLAYGLSIDNLAYDDIAKFGLQRGAMVVTIKQDNTFTIDHNNAYTHYHCDQNKFYDVNLDKQLYDGYAPTNR